MRPVLRAFFLNVLKRTGRDSAVMFHPILSRNRALLILESRIFAMAFQVFMSFDLHDASEEDYTKFYNALAKIGLNHWVKGNIGKLELPHSAVIGDFTGISVEDVRDRVRGSVVQILEATRLKGFIFVAVGENGTWGSQSLS